MNPLLYVRIALYVGLAGLSFLAGWKIEYWREDRSQEVLEASDARAAAAGNAAALAATQAELGKAQATARNNAEIIERLTHENEALLAGRAADVALAHRLLAGTSSAAACPAGAAVPEAPDRPVTADSGGTIGADPAAALADTLEECTRNADRLDALIAEVKPQL